jgi:plastocyanin
MNLELSKYNLVHIARMVCQDVTVCHLGWTSMATTDNTVNMIGTDNDGHDIGERFNPEIISIAAGTAMHWINNDDEQHKVKATPKLLVILRHLLKILI